MKASRGAAAMALAGLGLLFLGCGPSGASGDAGAPAPSSDDGEGLEARGEVTPPQPLLKDLGPSGRRVKVIVLPGDAAIEVDGIAVRRLDGVIELTGKVGEIRRLRVFKGLQSIEQGVTIQDAVAPPELLDLNARPARAAVPSGPRPASSSAPTATPLAPEEFYY